jgi:hypothetical protein
MISRLVLPTLQTEKSELTEQDTIRHVEYPFCEDCVFSEMAHENSAHPICLFTNINTQIFMIVVHLGSVYLGLVPESLVGVY